MQSRQPGSPSKSQVLASHWCALLTKEGLPRKRQYKPRYFALLARRRVWAILGCSPVPNQWQYGWQNQVESFWTIGCCSQFPWNLERHLAHSISGRRSFLYRLWSKCIVPMSKYPAHTCCVCINGCNEPPKYRSSGREWTTCKRRVCRPFQPAFPQGNSEICKPQSQRKADYCPTPSPNTKTPVNLRIDVVSSTYNNYSRGRTITPSPIMVWRLTVENWMINLRELSADTKA